jgi:transketolase
VIVATYATFASMRALEQLRTFIAYPRLRVIVAAGLGGLSGGIEGVAHLGVEDLGILRCVPGLTILVPADAPETSALVRGAVEVDGPVYLRLGRDDSPVLFDDPVERRIGSGVVLARYGDDAALLTQGLVTAEVLAAAAMLQRSGLDTTVVELPTLKPLDAALVRAAVAETSLVVTVEEHSVVGGLGAAVADVLFDRAIGHRIGLPDQFLESGSPGELRVKFGLTADAIAAHVRVLHATGAGGPRAQARQTARR